MVDYLLGENLILLDFSSLSMVAILVCESHRQAGSSNPPQIENTKENIEYSSPIFMELKSPAATNLKYKLNVRVAFSSNVQKILTEVL